MIDLSFNLATGTARLAQAAIVKAAGTVLVRITFSETPGRVDSVQLAMGSDTSPPEILAFADSFQPESDRVWSGWLATGDTRMAAHLNGRSSTVNAELTVEIDDRIYVCPNLPISVQSRILMPPGSTASGPSYYTTTQVDAALAALTIVDGINGQSYRIVSNNGILGLQPIS